MLSGKHFLQFLRLDEERLPTVHFSLLLGIVFSLFFSRFALTVCIVALFLVTLASQVLYKRILVASARWFALPAVILLFYLISIYYSTDIFIGLEAAKVKALFLILPFILLSSWMISSRQINYIYHFFLLLALLCSVWSIAQIPIRNINLSDSYARGEVIPTITHHIRFSIMVAFSAIMSWMIALREKQYRMLPNWVYAVAAVFFTTFLHILAVRSGLAGFYAASLFLLAISFTNKRHIGLKLFALIAGIAIVFIAYKFIPSLNSKVNYTIYSMQRFLEGSDDLGNYSDNRRLISYEAAVDLIKKHPWSGVGIGDVRSEIDLYYDANYPFVDKTNLHPHNQYLFTAVAAGIPVAVYLLIFNLLLLLHHVRAKNLLLVAFNIILILSFLVEDTLEMQIGVIVYLLFNYLGWGSKALAR